MLITLLKSGKFALHPARGPVLSCKFGESHDLSDAEAQELINAGWAEIAETEPDDAPEDTEPEVWDEEEDALNTSKIDPVAKPWEQEDWNPRAANAKDLLEAYGIEALGIDVDKRSSIKKIIDLLEASVPLEADDNG